MTCKCDNGLTPDQRHDLKALLAQTLTNGVMAERARILRALIAVGPSGDFFEMRYDQLAELISPADAE